MKSRIRITALSLGLATAGALGVATGVVAQPSGGPSDHRRMCGGGQAMGPGGGHGMMGPGGGHGADMMGIHSLFASRDQIRRTVTPIPGGVRATTESDNPAVVAQLREHVQSMYAR